MDEPKRKGSGGGLTGSSGKTHTRRQSANPLISRKTKKGSNTKDNNNASSSTSSTGDNTPYGSPTGGHVFGRELEAVLKWQGKGTVPQIVTETITWLENNNAANEEGIFRIPGQMVIINELKAKYDHEGTADLSGVQDVASVAGLLKLYLRELPEPLFVYRFYSTFVKIAKNPDTPSRLRNLRILLNGLPEANKAIIFYLLRFLGRVVEKEAINKMSSANLAMIFAPNLLRAQKEELSQIMLDAGYLNSVVRSLIEEVDYMEHKTDVPKSAQYEMEAPVASPVVPHAAQPTATTTSTTSPDSAVETEEDKQKRQELEDVQRQLREKEELLQVLKTQLADEGEGQSDDEAKSDGEQSDNEQPEEKKDSAAAVEQETTTPTESEAQTEPTSAPEPQAVVAEEAEAEAAALVEAPTTEETNDEAAEEAEEAEPQKTPEADGKANNDEQPSSP